MPFFQCRPILAALSGLLAAVYSFGSKGWAQVRVSVLRWGTVSRLWGVILWLAVPYRQFRPFSAGLWEWYCFLCPCCSQKLHRRGLRI